MNVSLIILNIFEISTSSPEYHRSNGMAENAVGISKNILRKGSETSQDYRELLMEYNNTPSSLVSPSQILNSRRLRTSLPMTSAHLEPKVQKGIANLLKLKQVITKTRHDASASRSVKTYKPGDNVVVKTSRDSHCRKAVIVKKAKEPRSYWSNYEMGTQSVRRNTSQIKPACSKVHPDPSTDIPYDWKDTYDTGEGSESLDLPEPPTLQAVPIPPPNPRINQGSAPPPHRTRSGRAVRPPQRLSL